jgi:cold-inducible RNA-binding protein
MSNRLYVGNLPFHTTDSLLNERFSVCGEVKEAQVVVDRVSGQSRGFGFVEMATPDGAQKAITEFHGKDFEGRSLRVDFAQERPRR